MIRSSAVFFALIAACVAHNGEFLRSVQRPGPQYYPSAGEPWPKPQLRKNYGGFMIMRPPIFRFEVIFN